MQPKKNPKKPNINHVRIIAGDYRRRNVGFIDSDGLRPTPDRVRETLFNWLMNEIVNASVLDCCAGSGVLGFEAISRGAKQVVMIEPNLAQYQQLLATKQSLNIPDNRLQCYQNTAENVLNSLQQPFDIIFLDPPYQLNLWQTLLELLLQQDLIHQQTLIYIEADQPHEHYLPQIQTQFNPIKDKKMGQIYVGLYQMIDKY